MFPKNTSSNHFEVEFAKVKLNSGRTDNRNILEVRVNF